MQNKNAKMCYTRLLVSRMGYASRYSLHGARVRPRPRTDTSPPHGVDTCMRTRAPHVLFSRTPAVFSIPELRFEVLAGADARRDGHLGANLTMIWFLSRPRPPFAPKLPGFQWGADA